MTDQALQRDIGRMESQIENLVDEVKALRTEVSTLKTKFDNMDGGKRALWQLLTAAGTLGGLIVAAIQYFWPFAGK